MTRTSILALVVVATLGVASTFACIDRRTCYVGEYLGCTCSGGANGYQACTASEDGYAACVCDGTTPGVDASPPIAADAAVDADGSQSGFLSPCVANTDCDSGLCQDFSMRGRFCTKPCTQATAAIDCPPPSPGCNGQNVCRAP